MSQRPLTRDRPPGRTKPASDRAGIPKGEARLSPGVAIGIIAAAVLATAAIFLLREKRIAGEWGYPLDDSWIYATMARNLATGHGFSFNADQPVAGATGPLYTFILAGLYAMFHEVVWSGKIFGVLCQIGSGVAVYAAGTALWPGRRLFALLLALLVVTSPPLAWGMLSGMEIPLYLLVVCAGIALYVRGRASLAVLLWSIGVWVRPDGLFLVALGLLGPPREAARRALIASAPIVTFLLFNRWIGGHWMPQTVGAKAHFGIDLVDRTWNLLREWGAMWGIPYRHTDQVEEPIAFLFLLLLGAALTWRKRPVLALYAIGFPLALSLFREQSGSHKRYILFVIPFALVLVWTAVDFVTRKWAGRRASTAALALGGACLAWQLAFLPAKADAYGWNVQNISKMQVLLGKFAHLTTQPGEIVATNDIGAIGYFGERQVVDLMGLISPQRTLPENLQVYRPKLILVFLTWFRQYARDDPKSGNYVFFTADSTSRYELIAGVELEHNTICANNRMTVYVRRDPGEPSPTQRWLYRF